MRVIGLWTPINSPSISLHGVRPIQQISRSPFFYAGEEGKEGSDAFTATVCSPTWFLRSHTEAVFSGESVIFMRTFDHLQLEKFLTARCASAEGNSWDEIAFELSRVGLW
ncbi:MAG: hypothetical protein E5V34_00665, partial [Mesorhizobium sp.]